MKLFNTHIVLYIMKSKSHVCFDLDMEHGLIHLELLYIDIFIMGFHLKVIGSYLNPVVMLIRNFLPKQE